MKPLNQKLKQKTICTINIFKAEDLKVIILLLEVLITELNKLINTTKALYYENLNKKLNNSLLQAKAYWSILKMFYNDKKNPLIPALLVNGKFVTDIKTKVCIFNNFSQTNLHP